MDANEVRINNFVINRYTDKVCSLVAIIPPDIGSFKEFRFGMFFIEDSEGKIHETSDVDPVPLTEQWLRRFGFVEQSNGEDNFYRLNGIRFPTWNENDEFTLYNNAFNRIKYVHQLQNLYFALTGEELVIN